jgi:hypothetical protein
LGVNGGRGACGQQGSGSGDNGGLLESVSGGWRCILHISPLV